MWYRVVKAAFGVAKQEKQSNDGSTVSVIAPENMSILNPGNISIINTNIDDEKAIALASVLEQNTELTDLDISGNEIMFNENKLKEEYLNEINRILIPGGRFYCERRLDENTRCLYVYTKSKN